MRAIHEIIVHCSATKPEWMEGYSVGAKVDEIRRWHRGLGWRDIGYHLVIDRDGSIGAGRPIDQTGAHVKGHNTGSIGVCLLGAHGASADDEFAEHFTVSQGNTLRRVLDELSAKYGPGLKITGHNQYANKGCPGFHVPSWLKRDLPPKPRPAHPQPESSVTTPKERVSIGAILAAVAAAIIGLIIAGA